MASFERVHSTKFSSHSKTLSVISRPSRHPTVLIITNGQSPHSPLRYLNPQCCPVERLSPMKALLLTFLCCIPLVAQAQQPLTNQDVSKPIPNQESADYKSAFKEARKLGKNAAKDGKGMPKESAYRDFIDSRLKELGEKISDRISWSAGFMAGYRQGWIDVSGEELASVTPGLTYSNYLKLRDGMKYKLVAWILGSPGIENLRAGGGSAAHVSYKWGAGSVYVGVMFVGDKLIGKSQFGLK